MRPKPLPNSSTRCIQPIQLLLSFYPRPVAAKPRPTPLLQPNVSPDRPRGGARGRGGGQRGSRGRGGAGTKRGGPMGMFEPKLVSGLSSQDLAGTVYDFDDFNDDVSDAERSCPKMIRKPESASFSSPLSSGKSPKCKSGLNATTAGGLRTRKSREASTDSAIDSENELSRRMSSSSALPLAVSNSHHPDIRSSPIRKRFIESEAPPPPQVVPPMRLTISQRSHWQHQCRNASLLIKSRRTISASSGGFMAGGGRGGKSHHHISIPKAVASFGSTGSTTLGTAMTTPPPSAPTCGPAGRLPLSRELWNLQMSQAVGDPLSTAAGADKTMETEVGK